MLPTFVIGLREGLEAVLIVSIIATFLRRNGATLRAMWVGVVAAVALSIAVGVLLQVVDQNLPQRGQEGMETVIGAVAVFFVTSMILWMRRHARHLKRELESAAEDALGSGTTTALAVMVFLAVLREGFETSVFLLSTFQASTDPSASAGGAVLGILAAVVIGYGIYKGGVRLNLARFFKVTGVFLVFVAAGLVLSSLRTAHEAGWLTIGQGTTVDLSWLAPTGAVRTALISGVLGIPRDPRQIELLGWACYLLPVLAVTLWPASWHLSTRAVTRVRWASAGLLVAVAVAFALEVSLPATAVPSSAPLDGGGRVALTTQGDSGQVRLSGAGATSTWSLSDPTPDSTSGADTAWQITPPTTELPTSLDLETLLGYTGQRVPVGLDVRSAPGPYAATWHVQGDPGTVLTRDGGLVDGHANGRLLLTLSGGGLSSSRVITVDSGPASALTWAVSSDYVGQTSTAISAVGASRSDRLLWKVWFPAFLVLVAAGLVLTNLRRRLEPRTARAKSAVRERSPAHAPVTR